MPTVPPGSRQFGGAFEGRLGAGRVDDHVVVGGDPQGGPQALGRRGPGRPVTLDVHVGPEVTCGGHGAQPDRTGAQYEDPHPVGHTGPVEAVEGHAEGLDETGILQGDPGGERRGARGVDPHLVGQAAVERDAVHGSERVPALGSVSGEAPVTGAAVDHRQNGHRSPVVEGSRELVAEDGPRRPHGRQVEVGAADAGAGHGDADVSLRRVLRRPHELDAVRGHLDAAHPQDPGPSTAGPRSCRSTVIGGHGSGVPRRASASRRRPSV